MDFHENGRRLWRHSILSMRAADADPASEPSAAPCPPTDAASRKPALGGRLAGPGGYYNIGNAIGLVMGITLQGAAISSGDGAAAAAFGYFAGSASAAALTLATLVFFWSGEVYHRAWAQGGAPDPSLNRLGDFLSGVGALALGAAFFMLGQPLLAATAGLLHAAGKFGSALHDPGARAIAGWPAAWPDPFRSAVLLSRLPAMMAALLEIAAALPSGGDDATFASLAEPATLLVCTLLWARADLLLFASAPASAHTSGAEA